MFYLRNVRAIGIISVVLTKDSYGLAYHNKVLIIWHFQELILYFKCLLCVFSDNILFCDSSSSCYNVGMWEPARYLYCLLAGTH